MRLTLPALGLALVLTTVSSVGTGQRLRVSVDPRATALLMAAREAVAGNRLDVANDTLETALAVDPHNRDAYALLADVAGRQGLPGKAIRFYREALAIDPADVAVLAGQGEAMVQKGAVTKARENLARIRTLCAKSCPESARLAASIERGPPVGLQSAQATMPFAATPR